MPHSLPACPGRVARLGLPAAPPGGADRMALSSLSAASWFPGWLSGAEGHPRRDGDGSAWSWFYWNILRAPPGLSGPGWGLCVWGGHFKSPPGQKSVRLPSPLVPVVLGLTLGGRGCGTQQSQNLTRINPQEELCWPQGPQLEDAPVRQGRASFGGRRDRALFPSPPVLLRGPCAHSCPKAIPLVWCQGLPCPLLRGEVASVRCRLDLGTAPRQREGVLGKLGMAPWRSTSQTETRTQGPGAGQPQADH